jgi:hypothetical protein
MKNKTDLSETKNKCTFNLPLQLCIITFPHDLLQLPYIFANIQQGLNPVPKKKLFLSPETTGVLQP